MLIALFTLGFKTFLGKQITSRELKHFTVGDKGYIDKYVGKWFE